MSATGAGGYGELAIQAMVDASEVTSQSWAEFFFFLFLEKKPYMSALFAIAAISGDS